MGNGHSRSSSPILFQKRVRPYEATVTQTELRTSARQKRRINRCVRLLITIISFLLPQDPNCKYSTTRVVVQCFELDPLSWHEHDDLALPAPAHACLPRFGRPVAAWYTAN